MSCHVKCVMLCYITCVMCHNMLSDITGVMLYIPTKHNLHGVTIP